jgi:hypothetical protein
MDMGYTKEELLENLPDYVNNQIDDSKLKEAIKFEISNNPDFKMEFELASSTLNSFNNIEFSEPPVNYFDTLLPKINERIYNKSDKFNFIKRFSTLWKYAIPVAAIIIFFIGYKTIFRNNDYISNLNNDAHIVLKDFNHSDERKSDSSVKSEEKTTIDNSANVEDNNEAIGDIKKVRNYKRTKSEKINYTKKEELINSFLDISENSPDEEVFFSNDDDENANIEQDFDKMNKEEQNNLVSKIKNSNL